MTVDILIWVILFSMFLLAVPIYVSIGMATVIALLFSDIPLSILPLDLYKVSGMFPLLAIPGFIFAGSLMERGGMAAQIVSVVYAIIGRVRGGLGIVTIVGCMFFAAMIGSGGGTVAAVGTMMIPSMLKKGYGKDYATGVTCAGGTLGVLIPPSNPMIVYGVVANVSVANMFLAGFIPGAITGIALMITAYIMARIKGITGSKEPFIVKDFFRNFWQAKWSLFAPVLILGGIYGGIFTPVEASVVAVVYAIFVGFFITKQLNITRFIESISVTNSSSAVILVVIGVSMFFGRFLTMLQVPQKVSVAMLSITSEPILILLMIILFLIVVGMFMETLATVVIVTPIFLPLLIQIGIDPIVFGIILVMTNQIAMLTPPLGLVLFIVMRIADTSIERISIAVLPYLFALIICVLLLTLVFPNLILYLPRLLGGYSG